MELQTIAQTQKQMATQMQESLVRRADEQEAALAQMRREFKELEREVQGYNRSNSPRFDESGQREVDELQLVAGGWSEAKREHIEADARAMFEKLQATPLLKGIFIPYVRSSFCRIEIVYTDENVWARRKVQSTVLQHLKGLNFQSEIAGQEHAKFWFARNRTPHERAKIRAILQTQSLRLKFLDETLVEKDWRGKVWAAGTQVLFHVDRDTRPVQTLMLVDARGNETGWFLNVAQLVARLGATQEAVLAFFDAKSRAAHGDGRVPRSAQREAARASGLSERQHVVQARFAGSGAFGDQPRRSQGRAANGVLHCSRQHAPPPACPGSGGSTLFHSLEVPPQIMFLQEVGDVKDVALGGHDERLYDIAGVEFVGYVANPTLSHRSLLDMISTRVGLDLGAPLGATWVLMERLRLMDWALTDALSDMHESFPEWSQHIGELPHFLIYADDLIVFADTEAGLQAKVHLLVHALQRIGLQVNPHKCKVLTEMGGGACPGIWLPSSAIPLRGEDRLTFLGIPLGHGVGATTIMAHLLRKASNTFFAFKRLLDDAATPLFVRLALFESFVTAKWQWAAPAMFPDKRTLRQIEARKNTYLLSVCRVGAVPEWVHAYPSDTSAPMWCDSLRLM
ncbi:hypothetical protein AK812_SmicGene23032 [Symbiodinium microadriaticum]|uniref:Reverse transcriptase domain-containing protein n=1 Tax=Symbiodinium microadriaticum TaxID=2951 RepID=A0A1Q9DIC9_SYMMI|nr:hypothetical protein AK812_SmicGene23032 [Symbiodinium microadriaticum]